ncbi:MAG: T9SS type A sorting domain-containing protein [Bacteroidetes bacterium]|nr:T9SS type A sorting domain-containing protein [Bacteroidota bacterium]
MKKIVIYLILFTIHSLVSGQVYLSGMLSNPVIKSYLEENGQGPQYKSVIKEYPPVDIPFIDDFSYNGVYPDTNRWIDQDVYINAHYPIFPVDYGVATFDVLNASGNLYPGASPFPFIADHLTSYPIKLGNYTPTDSVYLSFYYQPQGRGDVPLPYDSLVLELGLYNGDSSFSHYKYTLVYGSEYLNPGEYIPPGNFIRPLPPYGCDTSIWTLLTDTLFYSDTLSIPCDSVFVYDTDWSHAWSAKGDTLENFLADNDVYFNRVMIPVVDTQWFRNDFQFRFYNWGSLSVINSWQSNTDHWHIDKVYLNAGRSFDDIYTQEIRFVEPGQSFINGYHSMPMWHYELEMMKDSFNVFIHNNDSSDRICTYKYSVFDGEGNNYPGFTYDGYTDALQPYADKTISDFYPFVKAPIISWFDFVNEDEFDYIVEHVAYDENEPSIGDTLTFVQKFRNYFAYDDGTAERSYGASATGTKMVVRFRITTLDTLRGVQIFFNRTQNNSNDRYFHIGVWNDNYGEPGQQIHWQENLKPQFNGLNEFYTFAFPDSITVKLGVGIYYIGVIQTTNDNLNIGFDRNNDARSKTLYTTDGEWIQSPFKGSLMIRPVVGKSIVESEPPVKKAPANLTVYPNPSNNEKYVTIELPARACNQDYRKYLTLRIFDLSGKLIYSAPYEDQLDISWFRNGFYILNVFNSAFTEHYTTKFIIAK